MSISDFTILFIAFLGGVFTGIYLYGILKKKKKEEAQKQDITPEGWEETQEGSTFFEAPSPGTKVGGPGSLLP